MARGWLNAAVLLGLAALITVSASRRTPSLVIEKRGQALDEMTALENRVSINPDDQAAVLALARGFLNRGSPGLALAVLERSPSVAQGSATGADVAATALMNAGKNRQALAMTRQALALCEAGSCEASVAARAARREELLEAVLAVGIEDMDSDPEAVERAYHRALRRVQLAMN